MHHLPKINCISRRSNANRNQLLGGATRDNRLRSYLIKVNAPLTARERSVVQLIAEGHTSTDIASILKLGVKTVEAHRIGAQHKLHLHSTAELVRYAIRNKFVS